MKRLPEFRTHKPPEGRKPSLSFFKMLNNQCPPPLSQPLLDNKDEVVTTMASSEATNTMEYSVLKGKNMKSDNRIF